MATAAMQSGSGGLTKGHVRVIAASSIGTMFEWYDFYLYGSLAAIIAKQFFSALNPTSGYIFALLAFAAGFFVRPFGALLFGRLGDLIGRKYTFLITIIIMGSSTFLVGLIPTYASIGVAAPIILIALRLLQGLALGGEYGGAATYVAEHAPPGKRGFYTSFIQITATFGLFLSLIVILLCRNALGKDFDDMGLAHSVLGVVLPAADLGLYPPAVAGVADVPADEGRRQRLQGAAHRVVPALGQSQDRAARAVRRDRGRGGGLVRRSVLCAVLPPADPEGRRASRPIS